ncbi:MAG: PepSY-associated TM helix domain-containing protein [Actinomycetota bacterium]
MGDGKRETGASLAADSGSGSRRWRSLWRVHFYAGVFAMPFICLMALTGLVILYTQPLQDATEGDVRLVTPREHAVSYDVQERAVERAYPKVTVTSLWTPPDREHSAIFLVDDGSASGRYVFVDQYTGKVLGDRDAGGGIVGISNRLHGYLNNDSVQISLPTVSALWDDGAVMRKYVVGDLVLEMLGVWTLVLVLSGLYLYWPRRSPSAGSRKRRGFLRVRWNEKGRPRWRDLHGLGGVVLIAGMMLTIASGMAWSTYWGPNFTALANKISPNSWTDAPPSEVGTRGDLDRLGNKIPWNTGDRPIPASYATTDAKLPAPLSLDSVVAIAERVKMKPGYSINFPTNEKDETTGKMVYGSFTVSNSWPRKTNEGRDLFLDQFSGKTLAESTGGGYGSVSYTMDTLVSTHMGTQLGILSRILMTLVCVLALWSVASASVMFWKRRRKGTLGLPRRPVDVRFARRLTITTWLLAVVFPVWGVTAGLVLGFDRFVIRRTRLRAAFGQR